MKIALFVITLAFVLLTCQRSFACDATTQTDASDGGCKNSDCGFSCPDTGGGGQISPLLGFNSLDLFLRERRKVRKLSLSNIPRTIGDRLVMDPSVIAVQRDSSVVCLGMCFARGEDTALRSNVLSVILKGEA
jgi:hypothetical protein